MLNRLQELCYDIAHHHYGEESENLFQPTPQQRATLYQQLNNQVSTMYKCVGTMERIKTTPLPFVYVIHLRTFLFLYLLLWNMTSMASSGWIALPALLAFNLSMLGIEAASVECECPFTKRSVLSWILRWYSSGRYRIFRRPLAFLGGIFKRKKHVDSHT